MSTFTRPFAPVATAARWRVSVPAALLIAAMALSSSTACLTSAFISEVRQDANSARLAAENAKRCAVIRKALAPALPSARAGADNPEGLLVVGGSPWFSIEATDNFTPETILAFELAVRQVQASQSPPARFRVRLMRELPGGAGRETVKTLDLAEPASRAP